MFASDSQNVDASVLAKILYAAATKASYLLFILCIGSRQIVADLSGGSLFTDGGTWLVGRWLVGSVMRSGPGFGSLTASDGFQQRFDTRRNSRRIRRRIICRDFQVGQVEFFLDQFADVE